KMYNSEIGLFFRIAYLVISSPDEQLILGLGKSLFVNPWINVGGVDILVTEIKPETIEIDNGFSTIFYETLGEVVIKTGEREGQTRHVSIDDDINKCVKDEITKQFKAATGIDEIIDLEILSSKQRQRAVIKNGSVINTFITLKLSFKLSADHKVHEFILTQGFGHHRKLGFGLVSPINKREVKI
ncbi:MAG: CRISPR-associated endoribonuclease Cas6, partial [Thermoplasmataceae archaeon]